MIKNLDKLFGIQKYKLFTEVFTYSVKFQYKIY